MANEFISPVARLVQGGFTLQEKKGDDGKPVLNDQGQPVKEMFIAIAIPKNDPNFVPFWQLIVQTAKSDFPHLFDAQGNCTHPQFSWKYQDGDGVDNTGQSVAGKPGFAGHHIIKMATQFLPKCFHYGKYDPSQQIQNPNDVIKKGYFVRVAGNMRGNGVTPQDRTKKPGLFISPNLIELVAFGEEIVSGPDANKVFGNAAPITALPAGASQTPVVGAGASPATGTPPMPNGAPPLPGAAATPAVATPAVGAPPLPAAAALPLPPAAAVGAPPLPPQQSQGPQFTMTASAQGASKEQLNGLGWTDAQLIAAGHMIQNW